MKEKEESKGKSKKIPDPRALEKMTSDISRKLSEQNFNTIEEAREYLNSVVKSGKVEKVPPKTAGNYSQDIMYEAFDTEDPVERIKLAEEALSINKDCVDAYVLLAEEKAKDISEKLSYYKMGVEAGEKTLGEFYFKENAGYFWGLMETRPYMRAKLGLAMVLWSAGLLKDAEKHCIEMLVLNEGDNQGVRYTLVDILAESQKFKELEILLEEYKDDCGAELLFNGVLSSFVLHGNCQKTIDRLKKAQKSNPYVPEYLAGVKSIGRFKGSQEYCTMGSEEEARSLADRMINSWKKLPAAVAWLKSVYGYDKPKSERNDPCLCGSGKKYKKCCGMNDSLK
ncbi:MAG: hypothetical protein A2231_11365 [Candidatus Firestonebacteria bacterium RIFOXYA2_FULL_40_8]|nr:MAG: hypothetical protein A2231_11365 [Candidatus Firestonebacteria bacterium RIFOXYA2_FULL_40_8]